MQGKAVHFPCKPEGSDPSPESQFSWSSKSVFPDSGNTVMKTLEPSSWILGSCSSYSQQAELLRTLCSWPRSCPTVLLTKDILSHMWATPLRVMIPLDLACDWVPCLWTFNLPPSGIDECPGGTVHDCKRDLPLPVSSPSKFSTCQDPSGTSSLVANEQEKRRENHQICQWDLDWVTALPSYDCGGLCKGHKRGLSCTSMGRACLLKHAWNPKLDFYHHIN